MIDEPEARGASRTLTAGRLIPVLVLFSGLVLVLSLGLHRYLSFEALSQHRDWLIGRVEALGALAAAAFVLIYAAAAALSVPGGAVLTMTAGFLFGTLAGSVYVVIGATLGAVVLFLAARTAFADALRARAGPALRRMEDGFREDAFSYILVLRLIPLFPFWLVNLVPALLGVSLRTYALGTLIGIVPGTLVYASVGNGLGAIFDAGRTPDLSIALKPEILGPILGLAVLSLLPVVYKTVKARRAGRG